MVINAKLCTGQADSITSFLASCFQIPLCGEHNTITCPEYICEYNFSGSLIYYFVFHYICKYK